MFPLISNQGLVFLFNFLLPPSLLLPIDGSNTHSGDGRNVEDLNKETNVASVGPTDPFSLSLVRRALAKISLNTTHSYLTFIQ